jgi:hypothetical protein
MFAIRKGVPSPKKTRANSKYPFAKLKVGTFFEVPANHPSAIRNSRGGCAVQSSAASYARRHNVNLVTQRQSDDSMRVFRRPMEDKS